MNENTILYQFPGMVHPSSHSLTLFPAHSFAFDEQNKKMNTYVNRKNSARRLIINVKVSRQIVVYKIVLFFSLHLSLRFGRDEEKDEMRNSTWLAATHQ